MKLQQTRVISIYFNQFISIFQDYFGKHVNSYEDSIWTKIGLGSVTTVEDLEPLHLLGDYLHPTLIEMANELEFSIRRLQYSSEMLLSRYGENAFDRQIEIEALGEAAMQNFAMFAGLARASRGYCIGLRYSAYETLAAGCLVQAFSPIIEKMALNIKHNRNGLQDAQKLVVESLLKQHKSQSKTMVPSVLNGVLQKADKK